MKIRIFIKKNGDKIFQRLEYNHTKAPANYPTKENWATEWVDIPIIYEEEKND